MLKHQSFNCNGRWMGHWDTKQERLQKKSSAICNCKLQIQTRCKTCLDKSCPMWLVWVISNLNLLAIAFCSDSVVVGLCWSNYYSCAAAMPGDHEDIPGDLKNSRPSGKSADQHECTSIVKWTPRRNSDAVSTDVPSASASPLVAFGEDASLSDSHAKDAQPMPGLFQVQCAVPDCGKVFMRQPSRILACKLPNKESSGSCYLCYLLLHVRSCFDWLAGCQGKFSYAPSIPPTGMLCLPKQAKPGRMQVWWKNSTRWNHRMQPRLWKTWLNLQRRALVLGGCRL